MTPRDPAPVDRVEETARWIALARALESERKDAVFSDPFARRLAGSDVAAVQQVIDKLGGTWSLIARTHTIDALLRELIAGGVDAVVNLAAGLDSRPYRLDLPQKLTWIEVDHASVLEAKAATLADDTPRCQLERVALDLSHVAARRSFFESTRQRFGRVLVLTEGLLPYLPHQVVLSLASDLLLLEPLRWITDLHNGAVHQWIQTRAGQSLQGTAKMQFSTENGPLIFEPLGWRALSTTSNLKTALRIKRLPFLLSLVARLPEPSFGAAQRPWTGVSVLAPANRA